MIDVKRFAIYKIRDISVEKENIIILFNKNIEIFSYRIEYNKRLLIR